MQISGIDLCCASKFPGIMLANTVTDLGRLKKLPLLLINSTNHELSLRKGSIVGRADPVGKINDLFA